MQKKQPATPRPAKKLSALVCVANSAIHGQGLFAVRKIKRGTEIGKCEVKPSSKPGPYTLWDCGGNVDVVCDLRFINHSEEPTVAIFEDLQVVALCDIKKGEELTHHYDGLEVPWKDV